jgi:hypothetical protein
MQVRFVHGNDVLRIDYTPSGADIACGEVVNNGGMACICTSTEGIDDGAKGALAFAGGVWAATKAAGGGVTFAVGDMVGWDDAGNTAVTAGTGTVNLGLCTKAAVDAADEVEFALLPGALSYQTAITALTDNSGGAAADGTIAAVVDVATAANAIKELATKVNEIIAALNLAGIVV